MTDRRQHWDDDLIEAVAVAIVPDERERDAVTVEMVYRTIAAVEGWQLQHPEAFIGCILFRAVPPDAVCTCHEWATDACPTCLDGGAE